MDGDGVFELHVIDSDLDMNLFVRIEAVWWECDCFAAWIGPFWNMEEFYSASNNRKTY